MTNDDLIKLAVFFNFLYIFPVGGDLCQGLKSFLKLSSFYLASPKKLSIFIKKLSKEGEKPIKEAIMFSFHLAKLNFLLITLRPISEFI
jgi:hypothetical protein